MRRSQCVGQANSNKNPRRRPKAEKRVTRNSREKNLRKRETSADNERQTMHQPEDNNTKEKARQKKVTQDRSARGTDRKQIKQTKPRTGEYGITSQLLRTCSNLQQGGGKTPDRSFLQLSKKMGTPEGRTRQVDDRHEKGKKRITTRAATGPLI